MVILIEVSRLRVSSHNVLIEIECHTERPAVVGHEKEMKNGGDTLAEGGVDNRLD